MSSIGEVSPEKTWVPVERKPYIYTASCKDAVIYNSFCNSHYHKKLTSVLEVLGKLLNKNTSVVYSLLIRDLMKAAYLDAAQLGVAFTRLYTPSEEAIDSDRLIFIALVKRLTPYMDGIRLELLSFCIRKLAIRLNNQFFPEDLKSLKDLLHPVLTNPSADTSEHVEAFLRAMQELLNCEEYGIEELPSLGFRPFNEVIQDAENGVWTLTLKDDNRYVIHKSHGIQVVYKIKQTETEVIAEIELKPIDVKEFAEIRKLPAASYWERFAPAQLLATLYAPIEWLFQGDRQKRNASKSELSSYPDRAHFPLDLQCSLYRQSDYGDALIAFMRANKWTERVLTPDLMPTLERVNALLDTPKLVALVDTLAILFHISRNRLTELFVCACRERQPTYQYQADSFLQYLLRFPNESTRTRHEQFTKGLLRGRLLSFLEGLLRYQVHIPSDSARYFNQLPIAYREGEEVELCHNRAAILNALHTFYEEEIQVPTSAYTPPDMQTLALLVRAQRGISKITFKESAESLLLSALVIDHRDARTCTLYDGGGALCMSEIDYFELEAYLTTVRYKNSAVTQIGRSFIEQSTLRGIKNK